MIDGELTKEGKETRNVQVVLEGADPTVEFSLVNAEGRFLNRRGDPWKDIRPV